MIAAQRKIMIRSFGAIQNLNAMTALRGRMSSILLKQQLKPSSLESCFTPVMMQPTAANGSRVLQVRGFRRPPPQGKKFQEDSEVWVRQRNLKQSPLKMKFLVMLIRKAWIPDALAQLKFSPKHRATDLSAMIKVSSLADIPSALSFQSLLYVMICALL